MTDKIDYDKFTDTDVPKDFSVIAWATPALHWHGGLGSSESSLGPTKDVSLCSGAR
jgi:hypothetical protein